MKPLLNVSYRVACLLLILVAVVACAQTTDTQPTHGIAVANMDPSVKPGDDFYEYANGGWVNRTELPPDRGRLGVFGILDDLSQKRVAGLIEELTKANPEAGSSKKKIADLYSSFMDEPGIEAKGLDPLRGHLEAIAAIRDKHELARVLGRACARMLTRSTIRIFTLRTCSACGWPPVSTTLSTMLPT